MDKDHLRAMCKCLNAEGPENMEEEYVFPEWLRVNLKMLKVGKYGRRTCTFLKVYGECFEPEYGRNLICKILNVS